MSFEHKVVMLEVLRVATWLVTAFACGSVPCYLWLSQARFDAKFPNFSQRERYGAAVFMAIQAAVAVYLCVVLNHTTIKP